MWPSVGMKHSQHLQSSLHKEKTIKQAMRNAKSMLDCYLLSLLPNPNTTSTSQSAASSNNTLSSISLASPWSPGPNILFQASARRAASSLLLLLPFPCLQQLPQVCAAPQGVQASPHSCSDESDSRLSQKLEDLDNSLEVKTKPASGLGR